MQIRFCFKQLLKHKKTAVLRKKKKSIMLACTECVIYKRT